MYSLSLSLSSSYSFPPKPIEPSLSSYSSSMADKFSTFSSFWNSDSDLNKWVMRPFSLANTTSNLLSIVSLMLFSFSAFSITISYNLMPLYSFVHALYIRVLFIYLISNCTNTYFPCFFIQKILGDIICKYTRTNTHCHIYLKNAFEILRHVL